MYLMSTTRCGISAKQLERELGVAYKTAHRMFKQIRSMHLPDGSPLTGTVEVDETLIYGKPRRYKGGDVKIKPKTCVIGAVEREGRVRTEIIPDANRSNLVGFVRKTVVKGSSVFTDEHSGYLYLPKFGYPHKTVTHWDHEFARGPVHTNTIEGFWGNFKTGFRGVYKHCDGRYLQSYLNEYAFRYNHRKSDVSMFAHFQNQIRQLDWWTPYADRVRGSSICHASE